MRTFRWRVHRRLSSVELMPPRGDGRAGGIAMSDDEYTYHGSDDELTRWLRMFTSRNGNGAGDPEENYLGAIRLVATSKAGGSFLDIGSGLGRIIDIIKPYGRTVIGIEPDKHRFVQCRDGAKHDRNVKVLNCFSRDLKKSRPRKKFDLITLSMVLQHVSTGTCTEIISDVREMLKPNGIAIVASTHFFEERFTYEGDSSPKTKDQFDNYAELSAKQEDGIPVRLFSMDSFLNQFNNVGLEVVFWQQFFYVRPEYIRQVSADFGVSINDIQDVGFSQFCAVRHTQAGQRQPGRYPRNRLRLFHHG